MKSKITQSTNFLNTFIGKFNSKRILNSVAVFITILANQLPKNFLTPLGETLRHSDINSTDAPIVEPSGSFFDIWFIQRISFKSYRVKAFLPFVLVVSLLMGSTVWGQTITVTNVATTPVCAGTDVTITFNATKGSGTDKYDTSSIFKIYLSNSSGSSFIDQNSDFTGLIVFGSSGSAINITKSFTIPSSTPAGTGYKIAIGSTLPTFVASAGIGASSSFTVNQNAWWYLDADGDLFAASRIQSCSSPGAGYTLTVLPLTDCNDAVTSIYPGATEIPDDSIDQNCDGFDLKTWYADTDADTYGNASSSTTANSQPSGYVSDNTDCDDTDANEFPGQTWYIDADGDDYGVSSEAACLRPTNGFLLSELSGTGTDDCDDTDASIYPGATEIPDDSIDQNCDGFDLKTWYADTDADTYGNPSSSTTANSQPTGYVSDNTDCDDTDANEFPGQTWYIDADGDDYGVSSEAACLRPTNGFLLSELSGTGTDDCDDTDASIYPGATEIPDDSIDQNCDGFDLKTWYADTDADGYGNPSSSTTANSQPTGYVSDNTDCDDTDADINPGITLTVSVVNVAVTADTSDDGTGDCTVDVAISDAMFSDNCSSTLTWEMTGATIDTGSGQVGIHTFNIGETTIIYTNADGSANTATSSMTVTVSDDEDPAVVVTKNITVQLDATGNVSIVPADINDGSTDNCEIASYELDIEDFSCADIKGLLNTDNTATVTLKVTDIHGNFDIKTAVVTVEDNVKPVVVTKNITVQLDATGNVSIVPADINDGSTDNCEIASYELDIEDFSCADIKGLLNTDNTVTVTLKVTDIHGNFDTKTAVVTVEDNVKPVVVTKNITVQLDATGNVSIVPADINDGSTDNCEIASYELDIEDFSCADIKGLLNTDNTVTVTLKVTDIHGNFDIKTAVVTVEDNVAPVITCTSSSSRYVIPYDTYYKVTGSEFDATASDACGVASLTYKINGSASSANNASLSGVTLNVGTHTFEWTAVDFNGNISSCTTVVTVEKRPTTLTYDGDLTEQYSDQVDLSATLIDDISGDGVVGKTITFTINSQSTIGVTDVNGNATATLILTQSPIPSYDVVTTFAGDGSYISSSDSDGFDITQETALVEYIGNELTATTNLSATIDLRVSVQDLDDDYRGDIKKATVQFLIDGIQVMAPTPISQLLDLYTGIISKSWTASISKSEGSRQYEFEVVIDGFYATIEREITLITVYEPVGDFITGGGHIIPTASAGTYASKAGTKTNFGFNVKFNKKGTNLQGKLNFIWRSGGKVYQAKSNATDALGVNIADSSAKLAVFTSKCNINDITDPLNPLSLGGNKIMHITMTDRGEPGVNDDISFTLWDGNILLYSSQWTGNSSSEMYLRGGNLIVHSGFSLIPTATSTINSTNNTSVKVSKLDDADLVPLEFNVAAYPNPSADYFTLKLQGLSYEALQKVEVNVFDLLGRQVYSKQGNAQDSYEFGQNFQVGVYLVTVKQGNNVASLKVIKK